MGIGCRAFAGRFRPSEISHFDREAAIVDRRSLDTASLYLALDAVRAHRGLSWRLVAVEIGLPPSFFTRLAKGKYQSVDTLVRATGWLRMPMDNFVRKVRT